jgi:hypothetical protein
MQLREMRKNIETIKQGLRNGTDTGSTKFLDDMEKLSGLVLQLKVKTGFVVGDDLEPLVNEEIEKAKIELDYAGKITGDALGRITDKQVTIPDARISDKQYDSWLNEIKTNIPDDNEILKILTIMALKKAFLEYFDPPRKMQKTEYAVYKSMDAEIDRLKTLMKSTLNTNKIMSTTAFEKLNVISDTIPNIINQILSLTTGMSRIVVTKINEWSTEISNDDLSRIIDTSNELIGDIALINSKVAIQSYIKIYKKLKKPIEDIYKSVNEMGKLAGVISYDDNVKNQFKYINNIGYVNRAATQTNEPEVDYSNMFPPVPTFPDIDYSKMLPPLPIVPPAQPTGASGVGETKGAGKFMHSYHAKRFL